MKKEQRRCKIFNCDRRHGNYCCADCGYRERNCQNYCMNGPERCRQVKEPGGKAK